METFKPRASIRAPIDAAASPFPREETTPPVIKINLVFMDSPDRSTDLLTKTNKVGILHFHR
jgi:hypothetical protein